MCYTSPRTARRAVRCNLLSARREYQRGTPAQQKNYYRGKQALCVSATSPHVYSMSYQNFVTNSHFEAFDTEALCGQVEYSGMNLRGGQQIFFQAKNIGHNGIPAANGNAEVPPSRPTKALLHLNYQAMVVMLSLIHI